ncbi:acyl-CoA dehydrogenase family protein [uncultured Sphingomonas sp.]|uniref:acyl-CoA dehydrogenase family protein n=1 Tax=uncultured Sphingomonas sp. TaxID=158754 RepID=UPI0035CC62C7
MAFLYSDEQIAIGEEARRQLAARFDGKALRAILERGEGHDAGFWKTCGENGWTGVAIPEEHGGLGLGLIELCRIAEATGRVVAGAPFLSTSYAAAEAIARWGSDEQQAHWLPGLAAGETIGVLASTEGNSVAPRTPATQVRGGKLRGTKRAVTGGGAADVAIVQADAGDGETALFVVPLDDVERIALDAFDPSRAAADLIFDGQVAERLPRSDVASLGTLLCRLAVVVAAEQVGGADACIEVARDFANSRVAFGQPIGKFQSVKHGIAEMWVLNELARAATADAAHRFDSGAPGAELAAATARLNASDAYEQAAWLATQVHGGIGVTWEADLHLHYRRARATALELGQPAMWEDRIVAALEQQP